MAAANPGGQHRKAVRYAVKGWLDAQQVDGVTLVLANPEGDLPWDEHQDSHPSAMCFVEVLLPHRDEGRGAQVGPVNRGGKDLHYQVDLRVTYRAMDVSEGWAQWYDEYDRIIDALIDCLRGPGRDLGHPDLVLQVGEFPRDTGIRDDHEDPVELDDGGLELAGTISLTVTQYLATNIP